MYIVYLVYEKMEALAPKESMMLPVRKAKMGKDAPIAKEPMKPRIIRQISLESANLKREMKLVSLGSD